MKEDQKIPTGITGLDYLLKGGLLPNASVMVEGTPGTGKSTMGLQFIAEGIALGQPGIVVTLEEYPSEFYRDASHFGWDFRRWEEENKARVVATSPQALKEMLESGGPLEAEISAIGARRIMVDSVSQFERISVDTSYLRTVLGGLVHAFKMRGLLSLFTKDIEAMGSMQYWGRYTVDVLIELSFKLMKDRERHRFVEIHKARGQDHILGTNSFAITEGGILIYPRAQAEMRVSAEGLPSMERISSGIEGFDEMLAGGFVRGQSVLVAGSAGTGKSLLSASFVQAGLMANQSILYVSTEDQPGRVLQNANSVGIDLRPGVESGKLEIIYLPPVELSPDKLLYEITTRLASGKYARLVVDSISSLRSVSPEPDYLRDVIYSLEATCYDRNVAGLFTAEIEEITGPFRLTQFGASFIADVVILLRLAEVSGELKKTISVLKMRGSKHNPGFRELVFTKHGLKIGEQFENLSGILTGTPTAQRQVGFEAYFGEVTQDQQIVASVLSRRKEATAKEIAGETGMDPNLVAELLDGLAEAGFVTRVKTDGEVRYRYALMRAR